MVTSSSPLAAYGAIGAGIPPYEINEITTVAKAYSSAVGAGAFVSEIFGEEADELRKRGGDKGEFGATTGRPRRVGWFDAVATRYGCRVQGATSVALTVLDPLGYLKEIPMCVGYEIDGVVTKDFPTTQKLEKQSRYTRYCQAGIVISAESAITRICQRLAATISTPSSRRFRFRSHSYQTDREEKRSSTESQSYSNIYK